MYLFLGFFARQYQPSCADHTDANPHSYISPHCSFSLCFAATTIITITITITIISALLSSCFFHVDQDSSLPPNSNNQVLSQQQPRWRTPTPATHAHASLINVNIMHIHYCGQHMP